MEEKNQAPNTNPQRETRSPSEHQVDWHAELGAVSFVGATSAVRMFDWLFPVGDESQSEQPEVYTTL